MTEAAGHSTHGRRGAAAQRPTHPRPHRGPLRRTRPGPTRSWTRPSPAPPSVLRDTGLGPRRPGRRLRPQLGRVPDRLPGLRAGRPGARTGQPEPHRRRPRVHRRPVRQHAGPRRPRPRRPTPRRRTGVAAARRRRLAARAAGLDARRTTATSRAPRTWCSCSTPRAPRPLPKGAMMTHRALVHEYLSAIAALDLSAGDLPVHSLPLYHSAQMHVFLLPYLAVGAANTILDAPDAEQHLRPGRGGPRGQPVRPAHRVDRPVEPPRLRHPRPERAAQGLLRRVDHARARTGTAAGAAARSWPSTTASGRARSARWPWCSGRTSTRDGWTPAGARCCSSRRGSSTRTARTCPTARAGEIVYRSPQLCEGYWDKPEETAEAFRDGWFHSGDGLAEHGGAGLDPEQVGLVGAGQVGVDRSPRPRSGAVRARRARRRGWWASPLCRKPGSSTSLR